MLRFALLAVAALIAYGSLFPLDFSYPEGLGSRFAALLGDWRLFTSRGDVLGNIGLFAPFGLLAAAASRQSATPLRTLIAYFAAAALLAAACQVAQLFVPARRAAMADVVWNLVGTAFGMAAVRLAEHAMLRTAMVRQLVYPAGVIALWLFAELAPLVPTLSLSSLRENLAGLLVPRMSWTPAFLSASGLIVAGLFLRPFLRYSDIRAVLLALAALVVIGKVAIVNAGLGIGTTAGLLAGYWGFVLVARLARSEIATMAFLLLFITITVRGLDPFVFRDVPGAWHWMPFASWLKGSMLANVQSLAVGIFLYSATLSLVASMRRHVLSSGIMLAIWVLLLEVAQLWVDGRTPDVSEPLLVLAVAIVVRSLRQWAPSLEHEARSASAGADAEPASSRRYGPVRALLELVVVCMLIAFGIGAVLRLPGIPYNVAELFLGGGSFPARFTFALALIWTGLGAGLAAAFVFSSRHALLAWPTVLAGTGIVSLLLLSLGVTQESIRDIAGSTNVYWFVTNRDMWGTWWRELFLWIGSPELVAFFERPVRYIALYGPVVVFLVVAVMATKAIGRSLSGWRLAAIGAAAIPWLWLCKAIAFDWSSTDNLNELIARDGPWRLGGGGYLYALLALVCSTSAVIARASPRALSWAGALTTAVLALPLGWLLINLGLEAQLQKYSQTFSGVQFLLGPDRAHKLSDATLFGRWCAVQLAATVLLAEGLRIARGFGILSLRSSKATIEADARMHDASAGRQAARVPFGRARADAGK